MMRKIARRAPFCSGLPCGSGYKLLALLLAVGVMVGCSERPTRSDLSFRTSKAEAEYMLDHNRFYCSRSQDKNCVSGSVMVTFIQDVYDRSSKRDDYQVNLCTGFLLENNLVATNSHCVPEDLKKSLGQSVSCKGRISVSFPRNELNSQKPETIKEGVFTRRCASIEEVSDIGPEDGGPSPDYAYFRIETPPSWAEPFQMEAQGRYPKIGESIQTATMDTLGLKKSFDSEHRFAVAVQNRKSCRIIKVTPNTDPSVSRGPFQKIETSLYDGQEVKDELLTLSGECSIIPGNSGSPLWRTNDPNRHIIGIVQAISSDDANERNGFSYSVATPFSMMDLPLLESLIQ